MDIVIDAGNTNVKIGFYEQDKLQKILCVKYRNIDKALNALSTEHQIDSCLVCSVGMDLDWEKLIICKIMLKLSAKLKLNISNPNNIHHELGADRLALVGGTALSETVQSTLLIDCGTCVTYDFVDASGYYTCGNISPGLQSRLNSMHQYTSKLPRIIFDIPTIDSSTNRITTETCMNGGVLDGLIGEIEHMISIYRKEHGDFRIILTGGDCLFLAKQLKSAIFAEPNYLLDSLHTILKHNTQICES